MHKYTVADIVELDSCYEIQEIEQLWDGREALSLAEICRLNINLTDIIWVASELLPKRAARLYTCDCAEHVLWVFERKYPDDERPRECINVARRYANGTASREELDTAWVAAGDAAGAHPCRAAYAATDAAAYDAASAATWAAASVVSDADATARAAARDAGWDAIRVAARAATGDAISDAARDAARRTERKWQLNRLMEYVMEVK